MSNILFNIKNFLNMESESDLLKIIILSACFFIVLGSYTIVRELKDAVFILIVGKNFIPTAKIISNFLMIPLAIFYSWLSKKINKYNLLTFYTILYGLIGIVFAYLFNHESMGLSNGVAHINRIFGWIFYLFIEGYNPFVVSLMWAFLNSLSQPKDVKNNYLFITASAKLGGALFALLAWLFMSRKITFGLNLTEVQSYSFMMIFASLLVLLIPVLIYFLKKYVSKKDLIGYSEENEKNHAPASLKNILKNPYILGIYGMIFFWEIINVIFNFMRLSIGLDEATSISEFSAILYKQIMFMHIAAFLMVVFGTSSIVKYLGEKKALMSIPILTGIAIFSCMYFKTSNAVIVTYIIIRAIHYSISTPLRESLYIPTNKDMQFIVKSWIDSFGSKLSKGVGSGYNFIIQFISPSHLNIFQNTFFITIISSWILLTYLLGNRWEKAIKNKEIIGN